MPATVKDNKYFLFSIIEDLRGYAFCDKTVSPLNVNVPSFIENPSPSITSVLL